MSEHVAVTIEGGVLRIELRRAEKKNALTAAMYAAAADALAAAEADADVRVILIHGQPGVFTAGNDLKDFLDNPPLSDDTPVFRFISGFAALTKPFMAAVSGPAVGVGTTMLLHCDLVYADPSARFQLPFVNLGLCPEAASSLLLPALAGHARAAELLMLGEPFGAEQALAMGLINAVLPADGLLGHALGRAARLAAQPAGSVRATKMLMKRALRGPIADAMAAEAKEFRSRLTSPEAREAFAAFFEKRTPDFSRFS